MATDEPCTSTEAADFGGGLLARLPVVYAVAIAMREAGVSAAAIAARLELPEASIPALLDIATAKLAAVGRQALETQPAVSRTSIPTTPNQERQ